jgi:hypothetical protein
VVPWASSLEHGDIGLDRAKHQKGKNVMKYSIVCSKNKQQNTKSPEKQVLTWLRKRICPISWGVSDRNKSELHFKISKAQILKSYKARQLGGRGYFLSQMNNQVMIDHCLGGHIAYFHSDGRTKTPETLALIDIDCHEIGSYEGAVACTEWLQNNGFPGLFHSRSTNRKGKHAYIRIDKRHESDASLNEGLKQLEKWLQVELKLNGWDIQDIEVKGRPLVMTWGEEQYQLEDVSMGNLAKLPVEALDRPLELMGTTVKTVKDLRHYGYLANRLQLSLTQEEPVAVEFGEIDEAELLQVKWSPDLRHREWPKWVMFTAKEGLQEGADLGQVLHELGKWLLWVELFDQEDKQEKATELLRWFVRHRHNGRISRMSQGLRGEVDSQIDRCLKSASIINSYGKELMARIRQGRKNGKYVHVYQVVPLLSGQEKDFQTDCLPSTYCLSLRNTRLPLKLEAQLAKIAQDTKMRKRDGEYPLVIFTRRFLNHLWDNKGSARIGCEKLTEMAGSKNPNKQVAYKKLLAAHRIIEDYQGKYCQGGANNRYTLSQGAQASFEQECFEQTA